MSLIRHELHRLRFRFIPFTLIVFLSAGLPIVLLPRNYEYFVNAFYLSIVLILKAPPFYSSFLEPPLPPFLPETLRPLAIMVFQCYTSIMDFASDVVYVIPFIIAPFAALGASLLSLRESSDLLVLTRVSRRRLLLTRSLLSTTLFALVSLVGVYLARYVYLQQIFVPFIRSMVYSLTGAVYLSAPVVFLYILAAVGVTNFTHELFDLSPEASKLAYLVPILFLMDLLFLLPSVSVNFTPRFTLHTNGAMITYALLQMTTHTATPCSFIFDPTGFVYHLFSFHLVPLTIPTTSPELLIQSLVNNIAGGRLLLCNPFQALLFFVLLAAFLPVSYIVLRSRDLYSYL